MSSAPALVHLAAAQAPVAVSGQWSAEQRQSATQTHVNAARGTLFFTILDVVLLSGFVIAGQISVMDVIAFGGAALSLCALYRLAIGHDLHLRGGGVPLTMVVACMVSALMLGTALLVPQIGMLTMMTMMPTIAMTSLSLSARHTAALCVVLGVCCSALMGLRGDELTLPMHTGLERALSAVWFTQLLGRGAMVNLIGTHLRREISRKSAALADVLQQMEQLATHDELTGLLNRRAAMKILSDEDRRAGSDSAFYSVGIFDIDHFKQINDALGHSKGDEVLKRFASALQSGARANDRFARIGGEEFLLVMPGQQDAGGALRVADRLRKMAQDQAWSEIDPALAVTVSVGVATSRKGECLEELLARADKALYRAKHDGRNCVRSA